MANTEKSYVPTWKFGNYLWHHEVTGAAIESVLNKVGGNYNGYVNCTGSGGTIVAGDYLKKVYPTSKYLPWVIMNYMGIVFSIILAITGFGIAKFDPSKEDAA